MKLSFLPLILLPLTSAHADNFGSGANAFAIDFVGIGDPGNGADTNGRGAISYEFRMGVTEVSRGMIDSYNAVAGGGSALTMSDMASLGGNGADRPATGISWNEAARFVNWLNTSKGHSAAYKFTTGGPNDNLVQWDAGDAGYDPSNPFRNTDARYFIPSYNEWYKAAYYDPDAAGGAGGYWNFATGSDSEPTAVDGGTDPGTAVYSQSFTTGPADVANAGGLSPFGTRGQGGNVLEWTESYVINTSSEVQRAYGGGAWNSSLTILTAQTLLYTAPSSDSFNRGFRVAAVPEPSTSLLASLALIAALALRRRR